MLSINHLDIRYGDKHLFKDISVQIHRQNRIGLTGVNGAGKSTLLKIMAGVVASDDGVVTRAKYCTLGYLAQESLDVFSQRSIYEEAKTAFAPLLKLQEQLGHLNEQMQEMDPQSGEFEPVMRQYGEISHQLEASEIYTIEGKIEKVLLGLGFSREDMAKPAISFSGGWQMRLKLAKMLLEAPSLLLLDEPTNHLDLQSLTWLEQFLQNNKGAMVIISHDRSFLDQTTTVTWELNLGRLNSYKGNYSYHLKEKEERQIIEKGAYENQQAKIRQTMRFVDKFRAKATKARQVQSRVKQLAKTERIELGARESQIKFTFPPAPPSGRDVVKMENVSKYYDGSKIFSNVDLLLNRGDKVAVVGVNGAGKSTLLKIFANQIDYDSGTIHLGAKVRLSYFGQHQAQELPPELTVLQTIACAGEDMTVTQTRSLLGAFLFRGDDVDKKVSVLSGGEKSRLALAKMLTNPANCMLLDEPTNHLDMSSQDVLQEAMVQYDGTIVVVSHNRFFLDGFINRVLEVKDGHINPYEGNVSDYLAKQDQDQERETQDISHTDKKTLKSSDVRQSRKEQKRLEAQRRQERSKRAGLWLKRLAEAEKKLKLFEDQKEELEALMADPKLYSDEKSWAKANKDYEDCKRRLNRWYEKWEMAQDRLDEIDASLNVIIS